MIRVRMFAAACAAAAMVGPAPGEEAVNMELKSPSFDDGQGIPPRFTCDGADVSPELQWSGAPVGTASFVLLVDDPDAPAGTWDHWLVFDLPPDCQGLSESVARLPVGASHGANSWGRSDYGGPCPPGGTHRYFFRLYALDATLGLEAGSGKAAVRKAMEGHVLAEAALMGTYSRR